MIFNLFETFLKLSIDASATGYFAEYSLPGDRNTFVFSKLQDGETFNIKIEYIVVPYKSETEVKKIENIVLEDFFTNIISDNICSPVWSVQHQTFGSNKF